MKRFLCYLSILLLFSCDVKEDPEATSSKLLAYSYAEEFISEKLKDPDSAEFPSMFNKPDHVRHLGNWEYQIVSWVSSKNSFNATIKAKFSCKIKFNKENGEVSMNSLTME